MATRRLAALLALLALAGCDGGEEEERDPVEGSGYSFTVPDGWEHDREAASELEIGGFSPDSIVTGERVDGFLTNVNVVREEGLPEGLTAAEYGEAGIATVRDPDAARLPPELAEVIEQANPTAFKGPRSTELGGEDAVSWEYTSTQDGTRLRQRQVGAVRDGAGFTVTLSAAPAAFGDGVEALEEVVESWRWE